jgi:hypothetical protein
VHRPPAGGGARLLANLANRHDCITGVAAFVSKTQHLVTDDKIFLTCIDICISQIHYVTQMSKHKIKETFRRL